MQINCIFLCPPRGLLSKSLLFIVATPTTMRRAASPTAFKGKPTCCTYWGTSSTLWKDDSLGDSMANIARNPLVRVPRSTASAISSQSARRARVTFSGVAGVSAGVWHTSYISGWRTKQGADHLTWKLQSGSKPWQTAAACFTHTNVVSATFTSHVVPRREEVSKLIDKTLWGNVWSSLTVMAFTPPKLSLLQLFKLFLCQAPLWWYRNFVSRPPHSTAPEPSCPKWVKIYKSLVFFTFPLQFIVQFV